MELERMIHLTCSKTVDINTLNYEELMYYSMHNIYLIVNFLGIKYYKIIKEENGHKYSRCNNRVN